MGEKSRVFILCSEELFEKITKNVCFEIFVIFTISHVKMILADFIVLIAAY